MTTNEINYAYKVRHALTENLDYIPAPAIERLAAARKQALARKKKHAPLRVRASRSALAGAGGIGSLFNNLPFSWLGRMGVALPVMLVAAGLVGIYQYEQQQRMREIAEIDAQVLADELPLNAYLDHGFNAFLSKRGK